jgi:hypothetical protein
MLRVSAYRTRKNLHPDSSNQDENQTSQTAVARDTPVILSAVDLRTLFDMPVLAILLAETMRVRISWVLHTEKI